MEQFRIHSKSWMDTDSPFVEQPTRAVVPLQNGGKAVTLSFTDTRRFWSALVRWRRRLDHAAQIASEIGDEQ